MTKYDLPSAGKITADWGDRCPDHDPGCFCCQMWAMHDEVNRLKRENEHFTSSGIIEVAVRNQSVSDYMNHWEGRALSAEQKVAEFQSALSTSKPVAEAVKVPAGWKLVPIDPTEEMIKAADIAGAKVWHTGERMAAAMLSAGIMSALSTPPQPDEIAALSERCAELEAALKPFAEAFERRRDAYSKRYQDRDLGYANFDKMPDDWAIEKVAFNMAAYRRARSAIIQEQKEAQL